jgi:hypothetical protein
MENLYKVYLKMLLFFYFLLINILLLLLLLSYFAKVKFHEGNTLEYSQLIIYHLFDFVKNLYEFQLRHILLYPSVIYLNDKEYALLDILIKMLLYLHMYFLLKPISIMYII